MTTQAWAWGEYFQVRSCGSVRVLGFRGASVRYWILRIGMYVYSWGPMTTMGLWRISQIGHDRGSQDLELGFGNRDRQSQASQRAEPEGKNRKNSLSLHEVQGTNSSGRVTAE
jgi:hypothetical protein